MLSAPVRPHPPVRFLALNPEQSTAVTALAAELGFALWPAPFQLEDGSLLVADIDLAALEAHRPGFVETLCATPESLEWTRCRSERQERAAFLRGGRD